MIVPISVWFDMTKFKFDIISLVENLVTKCLKKIRFYLVILA